MAHSPVGVVGAGTMGRGIAIACAAAGVDVIVLEKSPEALERALAGLARDLDADIAKWRRTEAEKRAVLARVRPARSVEDLSAARLVIEAVPEEAGLKGLVLEDLDRVLAPDAVLATNTSTLSISELATRVRRPERVIGLHFLFPAQRAPLVEIVRGLQTSDAAFAAARDFVRSLGKTGIEVFEYPGYVTTRVLIPFLNEAMHVVMEGVASPEDVDTAMKLGYGLPVGPLALADRMGLDEVMRWMRHLFDELGDAKYRPCPLLRKMVRAGRLGVKSGRGFFDYGSDPASEGEMEKAP